MMVTQRQQRRKRVYGTRSTTTTTTTTVNASHFEQYCFDEHIQSSTTAFLVPSLPPFHYRLWHPMSNPIADNLDYFTQQHDTNTTSTKPFNQHEYHLSLRHHHHSRLQQDDHVSSSTSPHQGMQDYSPFAMRRPDPSLWHSFVRRMSGVVPFPTAMPEQDDDDDIAAVPYSEYTSPFGTAAQYRPPPMLGEDDNLPSMEEVVQEGIRAATSAELKENYFEHPFESDTSAPGSAEIPPTAPWDTRPIKEAVTDAFEKYDEGKLFLSYGEQRL